MSAACRLPTPSQRACRKLFPAGMRASLEGGMT